MIKSEIFKFHYTYIERAVEKKSITQVNGSLKLYLSFSLRISLVTAKSMLIKIEIFDNNFVSSPGPYKETPYSGADSGGFLGAWRTPLEKNKGTEQRTLQLYLKPPPGG